MPQKKQNNMGQYLQAGGAIAGGIIGSIVPGAGTIAGATAGAALGGVAGGLADASQKQDAPSGVPQQPSQAYAMSQRQQKLSQDNLATLQQAEAGLPQLPEHLRQQYAPAVIQARMLEERQRGLV